MITKSHPSTVKSYYGHALYSLHYHTGPLYDNCPTKYWSGKVGTNSTVTVPGDTITYENSGKRYFNYCLHTRDSFEQLTDCATSYRVYCTHSVYRYGLGYNFKAGAWFVPSRPAEPILPTVTEDMRAAAWEELLPRLETGFSLANFMWELGELPALMKTVAHVAGVVSNPVVRSLLRKLGSRTAAEALLIVSFALLPLKSDIEFIASTLPIMRKKINEFIANGMKPQSYHYRKSLGSNEVKSGGSYNRFRIVRTESMYYATLRCRYRYQPLSELDALLRLWGLRVTPEAIWNAIPFSFVVDWILRVGDWLRQFDRDTAVTVEIIDYCDTVKALSIVEEATGEGTACNDLTLLMQQYPGVVMWRWTRSAYKRTPCLPNTGYYFPVLDSLSRRELVLSAALLRVQT